MQSRVRRLIGRRRGGGLGAADRYMGVFHREAAQSQDSVDPITELLSQLSGGWIESVPILYACTCIYIHVLCKLY